MGNTPKGFEPLSPANLRLPSSPIPRPGEIVTWYARSRMKGMLQGHDCNGQAVILDQFGLPVIKPYDQIRLESPLIQSRPNWYSLPAQGQIFRPPVEVTSHFKVLLAKRIPPGPRYIELIEEIWARGFEVFVVGGTVRDVLAGHLSNDVDIVTTMPLQILHRFVRAMYKYDPSSSAERGFIRIGGAPASGDPFIDVKVFSTSSPGTADAIFGVGFSEDMGHRDFACNALYYDPINDALIDPSGRGIADAISSTLSLVCTAEDPQQHAQIFIRGIKFAERGFTLTPATLDTLRDIYAGDLASMKLGFRISYIRAQILHKCKSKAEHQSVIDGLRQRMEHLGFREIWDREFVPVIERLFA